jgi:hypothetical protein
LLQYAELLYWQCYETLAVCPSSSASQYNIRSIRTY